MALTEIEVKRCEKALEGFFRRRRPPEHIRDQVDLGYRLSGQSVEIFEIRPGFRDESEKTETPVAKATFVRTQNLWRIYWMRRDRKWHSYAPHPEAGSLEAFLDVVDRDDWCCFFG
jgi:hypothetical protein